MSKARVLAKLGWRVFVVKAEIDQGVDSLDAVIWEIWEKEFDDYRPCDYLAETLLKEIEKRYPGCVVEIKVFGIGFHESASVNNRPAIKWD